MADIKYTPSFRDFRDYVDGEDPVRAEGPTGFNTWFGAIESDLAQLSTVVSAVDARLDQLEAPPPTSRRLTLPLRLLVSTDTINPGWSFSNDRLVPLVGFGDALFNLALPHGLVLGSLRATGRAKGASIKVTLSRFPIDGGGSPQELGSVTGTTDRFDGNGAISADKATVDANAYVYRIRAVATFLTGPVVAALTGLQLIVAA